MSGCELTRRAHKQTSVARHWMGYLSLKSGSDNDIRGKERLDLPIGR
jgi:hypothetical protein